MSLRASRGWMCRRRKVAQKAHEPDLNGDIQFVVWPVGSICMRLRRHDSMQQAEGEEQAEVELELSGLFVVWVAVSGKGIFRLVLQFSFPVF